VFARARELANEAVDEAPATHAVALVAFDERADVVVAPTTDRAAVRAAIDRLTPGFAGTRYGTALSRAADVLGARAGEVTVVTDLQQAGWQGTRRGPLAEDVTVQIKRVETPLRNLAVVGAERRGTRVEAAVRNFGLDERTASLTLAFDGTEAARATLVVPAQSVVTTRFDVPVPAEGAATVTVTDDGGVPADDARYLVLDPEAPTRILVIVADPAALGGGLYVERALKAAGADRAFLVTVLDGRALSAWSPEQLSREHALVLVGTRSLERRGREMVGAFLAGGGSALVTLGPDVDVATLGELIGVRTEVAAEASTLPGGAATLVLEDSRHPILRPFAGPAAALGDVVFFRYRAVGETGRRVLARFSGGAPALLESTASRGRLLLFTSDLDNAWNRFPLSPAFVPFMVETGRYLTERAGHRQSWVLPAVPAGIDPSPGVHAVTASPGEGEGRRVAVNVNVEESNPAPVSHDEFLAQIPRAPRTAEPDMAAEARQAEDDQRLWQWGLLVMFVALAGEGLVGRRAT
jgi:von Willebrand factor type A domain